MRNQHGRKVLNGIRRRLRRQYVFRLYGENVLHLISFFFFRFLSFFPSLPLFLSFSIF